MEDRSSAMPAWMYADPALVAERKQAMALGCSACKSAFKVMEVVRCEDPRNAYQKGVPTIGRRCKLFKPLGDA